MGYILGSVTRLFFPFLNWLKSFHCAFFIKVLCLVTGLTISIMVVGFIYVF